MELSILPVSKDLGNVNKAGKHLNFGGLARFVYQVKR